MQYAFGVGKESVMLIKSLINVSVEEVLERQAIKDLREIGPSDRKV